MWKKKIYIYITSNAENFALKDLKIWNYNLE